MSAVPDWSLRCVFIFSHVGAANIKKAAEAAAISKRSVMKHKMVPTEYICVNYICVTVLMTLGKSRGCSRISTATGGALAFGSSSARAATASSTTA